VYRGGVIVVPNNIKETKVPVNYYLIIEEDGEIPREILVGFHNQNLREKLNQRVIDRFKQFNLTLLF
jgi:hypothetical protein